MIVSAVIDRPRLAGSVDESGGAHVHRGEPVKKVVRQVL